MISIGFFSEMKLTAHDDGSINEYLMDEVDYDKKDVLKYLEACDKKASCAKFVIDCVTGNQISTYFTVLTDGEYIWPSFLIYHIQKYNIKLPQKFIEKIKTNKAA